jgi:SpoVK/Ycf46/Vps4 family AAA+-type ATPase
MANGNGDSQAQLLSVLLRAKFGVIGIVSKEERRVERAVVAVAQAGRDPYEVIYWSCTRGFTHITEGEDGKPAEVVMDNATDPLSALDFVQATQGRAVFVMRDFHPYIDMGDAEGIRVVRKLREVARDLRRSQGALARAIILLSPRLKLPPELEADVHVEEWPLPDREEMDQALATTIDVMPDTMKQQQAPREALVAASLGLSLEEAQGAWARSMAAKRALDPVTILEEKKQIVERAGALEWLEPLPGGLASVGGLDEIKGWLSRRRRGFSQEARRYGRKGLPMPRGVFMCGLPGAGKSYLARAVASEWGVTPIRFNVSGVFGRYVGDSEQNLRRNIQVIKAVAPCVLLIDEIDKALGGGTSINETDNRVKGELLTFLQDRNMKEPIFIMGSANNVEMMAQTSPEMLRKGRWDELFFFDLPTRLERREILRVQCQLLGVELPGEALDRIADLTPKFTGAELEAILIDAMYDAFDDGSRAVSVGDVLAQVRRTKPLAVTSKQRIESLRGWAEGKCRWASTRVADDAVDPDVRTVEL